MAALWGDVPTQRCTVHKHRNLLAHAPQRLHEEVSADYNDMIYATSAAEIDARRRTFIRKWRLKCKAVADSLEEAGDRLFTFTRLPVSQWRSARTTNAIERLHEEFKRRIKTQTVVPSAETAAMLFWALLAARSEDRRQLRAGSGLRDRVFREDLLDPLEGLLGRRLWRHTLFHDVDPADAPHVLVLDLGIGRVVHPKGRHCRP